MKPSNKEIMMWKIAESIGTFIGIKISLIENYLNMLKDQGIIKEDSIKVFKTKLPRDEESFRKFIYDEKLSCYRDETDLEFRDRYLKYLEGLNNDK